MVDHKWMYSAEAPEGRLFHVDEAVNLGPEWVDRPWKVGTTSEPAKKPVRRRKAAD